MPQPNQLHVRREDVNVTGADLLNVRGLSGAVTEKVRAVRAKYNV
jgi:malate synthase